MPADRGKGNRFKTNLVNKFVLFLWKKFSVNDIIHSEELNKMNHNNSETQICSANTVIALKSLPVAYGQKTAKTIVCAPSANFLPMHLLWIFHIC